MTMLDHDLAGLGDRLAAQIIDGFIPILVLFPLAILHGLLKEISGILIFFWALFYIYYILFADGFKGGQSYGKRVAKICVIDATSGKPCNWAGSAMRNIPLLFLGMIDWIFIFSKKRQRLGDRLANTIVVRRTHRSKAS
jgi:uncharacterized RDD family membrane protein YckC